MVATELQQILAEEKGAFPLYDSKLTTHQVLLRHYLTNSAGGLNSMASEIPTSLVSLRRELYHSLQTTLAEESNRVFSHYYDRTIQTFDGPRIDRVSDYAYTKGVEGRTANELTVDEHLSVLSLAQHYVDSACSKTINVGDNVSYAEFKDIYKTAWEQGIKGCTTFRA